MTKYGRSPWIDRAPASRVPVYPKYKGHADVDVAIIGGGLTGCMAAYAFAAAGVGVVLLESDRIGQGTTSLADGWISDDPGTRFADVEKVMGARAARSGWQAWRRASLDFIALVRRLNLKCELEPHGLLSVASNPDDVLLLKKEQEVRKDAGLETSIVNARSLIVEAGITAPAALRSKDGATIDPYRATIGLAAAAEERGARLFEHSSVSRTTFTRKIATVHTAEGTLKVRRVIVATGTPTVLFKSLRRHFWFKSSYAVLTERVPAKIRQQLGKRTMIVRDSAAPAHIIRWVDDDRILVVGADGPTVPPKLRGKTVVQRTGQLMYELSTIYPEISGLQPGYGWEAPYALTAEGLPYLGPHRNFPFHLFAFGDASPSVTGAYLASRVFLRNFLDEVDASDVAFTFTR
ncbi:MAG TPA: FAD-dependent oxidoreductase [Vicinamibacterales bacterium]|jgi:glycine/D-amino acid oxidase-like deaminating enzyme|nr:FAD-dependent oxidoreductase [Vicinamibacterales bacterium]